MAKKKGTTTRKHAAAACVPATIFADCFGGCNGTISRTSPGPICGWTFSEPFGPATGTIVFGQGKMKFKTTSNVDNPGDSKPLPSLLSSVLGISGQFHFKEYATPPIDLTSYTFFLTNGDLTQAVGLGLFGDGNAVLQFGDPLAINNFIGAWTPNNAAHEVYFAIDALGTPSLFVDQVAIPLTPVGSGESPAASLAPNLVAFFIGSADPAPGICPVDRVFVTAGNPGPATRFCCP